MSIEKKHAIVFTAPALGMGLSSGIVSAVDEFPQPEENNTSQTPEPPTPENDTALEQVSIEMPQRGQGITERLFANFDNEIPEDPRLQEPETGTGEQLNGLVYVQEEIESPKTEMTNPIPGGEFSIRRDLRVLPPSPTDTIARLASVATRPLRGSNIYDTQVTYPVQPSVETPVVERLPSQVSTRQSTPESQAFTQVQESTVTINGIRLGLPANTEQAISIEVTPDGVLLRSNNSDNKTPETTNTVSSTSNAVSINNMEVSASLEQNTELDSLVERIKQSAKQGENGYYYMPDPVLKNGKPTYLFDRNTCNSERRAYPENIATVLAISEKYDELVNTKYPQYKDTVLDVGDFMSRVHIEHDNDNPAVDLRSRKMTSPSGTYDGPAFVPVSNQYDIDFTLELIEYANSLTYQNKPILKYVIVRDSNNLSAKAQHLKRHDSERQLFVFKDDHSEHYHLAFNVFGELDELSLPTDFGEPCSVSGASFLETSSVVTQDSIYISDEFETEIVDSQEDSILNSEEAIVSAMSSTFNDEIMQQPLPSKPIIVDDEALIEHMRETIKVENENRAEEETESQINESSSIYAIESAENSVNESTLPGEIYPSSELARILATNTLTDGSRNTKEIVDDLSDFSKRILNEISSYAPVSPYVASELRNNNTGFSSYFPQLEKNDRQLTDTEVMARAIVAHEIVFGDRYGVEYTEDKIKSDVERLVAFSNRESLRYPAAVGDYKTEGKNSGSSGLVQILNWDVSIDSNRYEGIRDFDANLDPLQNLVHAFQIVDTNRASGRSAFADWESGWKSEEGRRADMEVYEENLGRLRQQGIYNQLENMEMKV